MNPDTMNMLEALLVSLCDAASTAGVPKEDFKKWMEQELPVQLDQYDEGW